MAFRTIIFTLGILVCMQGTHAGVLFAEPQEQSESAAEQAQGSNKPVKRESKVKSDSVQSTAEPESEVKRPFVGVIDMNMMILPGTQAYLEQAIQRTHDAGGKLLVVLLNTPGGILTTSQEMIQAIFKSPIPIVIYVSPSGATATSAGVFITMAAHVAAMAPGTSIGAAHPVTGEGKDIEGDLRKKAENMAVAMVKAITEQRGRNLNWAEKAVVESSSLTEREALDQKVVDLVANNLDDLLRQIAGMEVALAMGQKVVLEDYSSLPRQSFEMHFKHQVLNVLANPNVAALLWLGATTGLSMELYYPGAILPGMVGIICLILALLVSQIIPISQAGVLLMVVGAILIGLEMFVSSGILGVGGVIAMAFGAIYLVDVSQAPGLPAVAWEAILPAVLVCGGLLMYAVREVAHAYRTKGNTGKESLIGLEGRAMESFSDQGVVFVDGEIWKAVLQPGSPALQKNDRVEVTTLKEGLVVEVKKVE